MKSWKTTSTGILAIAGALVSFYFAYKNNSLDQATVMSIITALLGGIGLLFAKDSNVTGGTTQQ